MKKKIDPLQTAGTTKPVTTMYEVNDKGRENEYNYRSRNNFVNYIPDFVSLIESLGFEIGERTYKTDTTVVIDGYQFHIDTDNCSYKSRNAYTRDVNIRKPENRFIRLTKRDKTVIKIHFNKEYEVETLKAKIKKAMKEEDDIEQAHIERQQHQKNCITEIAMIYLHNDEVKKAISQIYVSNQNITIWFKDSASLTLNADGTFNSFAIHQDEMKSLSDVAAFSANIATRAGNFFLVVSIIMGMPTLPKRLTDWILEKNSEKFYVNTMSTEWKRSEEDTTEE